MKSQISPHTLEKKRTASCQKEMERSISELINAKNLKVSKDIFSESSSLYLNNKKDGMLNKSPIFNDLGGRKHLILYKKGSNLFVALLNHKEEIIKEKQLKKCD